MNAILDTIREIIARADEAKDAGDQLQYGRLLAFCEVLSVMKTDFVGVEEVEKLLDFDIDKRYLCK